MKKTMIALLLLSIFGSTVALTSTSSVKPVNTLMELETVLDTDKPVVVLFTANWCGACKAFHPTYESLSEKVKAQFITIDVDNKEFRQLITQVPSIPFVVVAQVHGHGKNAELKSCLASNGIYPIAEENVRIKDCLKKVQ